MSSDVIRPDPQVLIAHSSSEEESKSAPPVVEAGAPMARRDTDTDSSGENPRFKSKSKALKTKQPARRDSFGQGVVGMGGLMGMANMSVSGVRVTTSQRVIAVDSDEEEESSSASARHKAAAAVAPSGDENRERLSGVSPPPAGPRAALQRQDSQRPDTESSGDSPAFRRPRLRRATELSETSSSSSEDDEGPTPAAAAPLQEEAPQPTSARVAASDLIRATPKLGKLLGGPAGSGGSGDMGRPRKRSVTLGEGQAPLPVFSERGSRGSLVAAATSAGSPGDTSPGSVSPRSNNMTKVSKDTASALQAKAKNSLRKPPSGFGSNDEQLGSSAPSIAPASSPPPAEKRSPSYLGPSGSRASGTPVSPLPGPAGAPVTRMRRSSSVGSFDSPSWVRERSPRSQGAARVSPRPGGAAEGPAARSGRLSLTMWRPSGVGRDKFWFEVAVDYVSIYKSPQLHNKKPEWMCNVCCDASLDSLVIIRLCRGGKEADKCHLRLAGLALGTERACSLEFPGGERQQVALLALNFGELPPPPPAAAAAAASAAASPEKAVALDAPNVLDLVVSGLYDLRVPGKGTLSMQASYQEQVMRSGKLWTDPESARILEVNMDCTFRLCAANAELLLMLVCGDSFPGDVVCGARVGLLSTPQAVPLFVPLRDRAGQTRAFCHLRLSAGSPLRGMLGALGPPLVGVPLRLEWGDLVLFNLKSLSAQVVSAATASSWDHCGIVYEEDGKYFLLEAVSNGVQALELNSRVLDALTQGAKMAFRRLVLPRTPELRAELWSFAVGMTGRSYKKSVGQLVQSRWGRNKADDLSSVFCSELVAAAYKQLGLLEDSVVTCNVLPKDLAGDFALRRGALGPLIVYSTKLHSLFSSKHAVEFVGFLGEDENSAD